VGVIRRAREPSGTKTAHTPKHRCCYGARSFRLAVSVGPSCWRAGTPSGYASTRNASDVRRGAATIFDYMRQQEGQPDGLATGS
jgi:hypothetical protein